MAHPCVEYVDVSSDSEDETPIHFGLRDFDAELGRGAQQDALEDFSDVDFSDDFLDHNGLLDVLGEGYDPGHGAASEVIDLTNIPDIDVPPSDGPIVVADDATIPENGAAQLVTEAACLQMVMDVLPDISADHVLDLIKQKTKDPMRTLAQCESIITELLDGESYPKEVDEANKKKRKWTDEDDWSKYEKGEHDPDINYEQNA
jgi:TRIAD3 protein (E3 ubiquitin-protein ligase RNF216)